MTDEQHAELREYARQVAAQAPPITDQETLARIAGHLTAALQQDDHLPTASLERAA